LGLSDTVVVVDVLIVGPFGCKARSETELACGKAAIDLQSGTDALALAQSVSQDFTREIGVIRLQDHGGACPKAGLAILHASQEWRVIRLVAISPGIARAQTEG